MKPIIIEENTFNPVQGDGKIVIRLTNSVSHQSYNLSNCAGQAWKKHESKKALKAILEIEIERLIITLLRIK